MLTAATKTSLCLILTICLVTGARLSAAAPPVPAAPQVAGTGHLLIDPHSGYVISEFNADTRLEPASITKIMTGYLVFRELEQGGLKPSDQVLISEKAWRTPGSRMFVEVGTRVTLEDLLRGMVVQSGNDASVALAEHVAGSEEAFADLMNEHARRLGMDNTHFVNATGLPDPNHYTTPHDIARLTAAVIREFPKWYELYSEKEFTWNDIRQPNRNTLLWRDASVDGVKTGHTESAGYCLVASAERDGMRLISVVMGTASEAERASETLSLLNYGFRFFETHRLYGAGDALTATRVWKGEREQVALGVTRDLFVTIPRRRYDELQARTEIRPLIEAPVAQGDELGHLIVELDGASVAQAPLVALAGVPDGGLWRTAVDSVLMLLE
ncbi:MAG: D-alanyl-D-alanine carboxypeptidase [Gammaproteobacteria bacterium]